jgi:hypothetical protein
LPILRSRNELQADNNVDKVRRKNVTSEIGMALTHVEGRRKLRLPATNHCKNADYKCPAIQISPPMPDHYGLSLDYAIHNRFPVPRNRTGLASNVDLRETLLRERGRVSKMIAPYKGDDPATPSGTATLL